MLIQTNVLLSKLRTAGYSLFSGVPCSHFADLFDEAAREPGFLAIPAANEGSAVALAAGAVLSGRRAVVAELRFRKYHQPADVIINGQRNTDPAPPIRPRSPR